MQVDIIPRSELESRARRWAEEEFAPDPEARVRFANVRPVLGLSGGHFLFSRGKIWEVPAIPWQAGLKLMEILQGLDHLQDKNVTPATRDLYRGLLEAAVALFPSLVLPARKGLPRLIWRIRGRLGVRPNPWASCSEEEIRENLDFFWRSRMRSPGRFRAAQEGGAA